jgi:pimeloyl-ACP methyl ester carboxylesterase
MFLNKMNIGLIVIVIICTWLLASIYLRSQSDNFVFQSQLSGHSTVDNSYNLTFVQGDDGNNIAIRKYPYLGQNLTSEKTILFFHGNAGRLANFFPELNKIGTVYSPSYPGFHESEGKPSMKGSYDAAIKSYDYLVNTLKIPEDKIIIMGHSLGGSVATYLAANRNKAAKLVLINTFASVQSMCYRQYSILCIFSKDIFNSAENAKFVVQPVVQFAYNQDKTVPYDESIKLNTYFTKSQSNKFITMDKFTHTFPDWDKILKEI